MEEKLVFVVSHLSCGHAIVGVVVARVKEKKEVGGGAVEDAVHHARHIVAHLKKEKEKSRWIKIN